MKNIVFFVFLETVFLCASAKDYPEFYPQQEQLIERDAYTLLYSSEHKHPRWVIEHIDPSCLEGDAVRPREFDEDVEIYGPSRSCNEDYKGTGYDRGHNALSAHQKYSQSNMNETFLFSNITPQNHLLNTKTWEKLEKYIRNKIKVSDGDAFIITGPAYLPSPGKKRISFELIGNNVSVPTHWFKVFLQRDFRGDVTNIECYLMPNNNKPKKFKDYQVTIYEIEEKTKLLFPSLYKD